MKSYSEIAKELNLSIAEVKRIEKRALAKLKHNKVFKEYLLLSNDITKDSINL